MWTPGPRKGTAPTASITIASPAQFGRFVIAPSISDGSGNSIVSALSSSALPSSGKFYFEVDLTGGMNQGTADAVTGIYISGTNFFGIKPGTSSSTLVWNNNGGGLNSQTASPSAASPFTAKYAVDMGTGDVWVGKAGGGWDTIGGASPDPATGVNPAITMASIAGAKIILGAFALDATSIYSASALARLPSVEWLDTPPAGFGQPPA